MADNVSDSMHRFSAGPRESRLAFVTSNVFLQLSLTVCISSLSSFVILRKKNELRVLKTLLIFRDIAFVHQTVLVLLLFIALSRTITSLISGIPPTVILIQDVLFAASGVYLSVLSSSMVILILAYATDLVSEIPKLFEFGRLILKREYFFRFGMIVYGIWFSSLNEHDNVTLRSTISGVVFSFNIFDSIIICASSLFICNYMLEVYRKSNQRLFGNRTFRLIVVLLLIKIVSMFLNLTAVVLIGSDSNPPFHFFEVVRMTEGLLLGSVYVHLKAIHVILKK